MKITDTTYTIQLLQGWEDVFKKGQLTLWILLALHDGPKDMAGIREYMARTTNGLIAADDVSLYRALRRYYDNEITDYTTVPGKGPERKFYNLTPIGLSLLSHFVRRNIVDTLYQPEIRKTLERIAK
jgi:PadR family transcriptional regulator PadR